MAYKAEEIVVDLKGEAIKKLPRVMFHEPGRVTHLFLDNNLLQKLEYLTAFTNVVKFSASHNQLLRMYNIAPFKHVVSVDLSHNKIICIEGLKEALHLTFLNLSHNKIKDIDHLHNNVALEHLDLSENLITMISNISQLSKLKNLYLHHNLICHLRHAEVYLPKSIEILTLASNKIQDLNEISRLVGLVNLKELSIKSNPCIDMTGQSVGFDYRPFIVNWCLDIKGIDGYVVDELESLRGEWLYSQGKGRQFRIGEHSQLVNYLAENLPFNNESLQSEQEKKLRIILSKAQQHQSQLLSENLSRKSSTSHLMSRSLDPALLQGCSRDNSSPPADVLSQSLHITSDQDKELSVEEIPAPLPAASKLVPVPESLISPMVANVPEIPSYDESKPCTASSESSYYSCEEISTCKLQTIRTKADEIRSRKSASDTDLAALCIQKNWRGYRCRSSSPGVQDLFQRNKMRRINEHVKNLTNEVNILKVGFENERRLHILQMQAINALWRRVQHLHSSVQEALQRPCRSVSVATVSTQTDIVAVQTPDESIFPQSRPSSLALSTHQVTEYAEGLVGDVLKDTMEEQNREEEQ